MTQGTEGTFLFELSGEHPYLPLAELTATLRAECPGHVVLLSGPGYAVVKMLERSLRKVVDRVALTHRVGRFLGTWSHNGFETNDSVPEGTVAVRVKHIADQGKGIDSNDLTRRIAGIFAENRKIDLVKPDVEIRGLISDRVLLHFKMFEVDRSQYELRKVDQRPYFSPISLHPRYARAAVNLTCLRSGDVVLDPFCGTGGLLIEAALLGMRTCGSDISPEMIEGCRRNLEHFGLKPHRLEAIDVGDVPHVFGSVDGIASDPPYGRSTSTNKEGLDSLYSRSLNVLADSTRPDGRLCMVFPREVSIPSELELEGRYVQKVHRSLSRQYLVLRRR